ncbi:sigma-70 family RNA polymerase sigma factor [Streptomyces sp. PSKA30]|uniref:sigma-70 family RNA polymerase sigma factor n=1 Tax=Streptomyces sp. PSKA30 TaxID=2874597 RepID=UPI001CD04522|nr:sigma-70 family RNA polymerase sigma factor [Streptomyces sp. PSKA30]MBZ9641372.1 sigma-70 family RNA polymerase sigma factor [Streptomyces sp. PSKA30]
MTAGSTERGTGDSSPRERAPAPVAEAGAGTPLLISDTLAVPSKSETAAVPHQAAACEQQERAAAAAALLLKQEINRELLENRSRLRSYIAKQGYREPDLTDIESRTQIRYFAARMRPDFSLRHSDPWPFLVHCCRFARKDFHRDANQVESPEPEESLPQKVDDGPSATEQVTQRTAIESFLKRHVPHAGEREVWLLTYRDGMEPVEISKKLKIDRGTVTTWRKRAEERLKALPPDELDHLR